MDKTILVVEDRDDVREMYAQFLSLEGFHVVVATNGQEGVVRALEACPNLILMDLSLPVLGGVEATKQIKTHPKTQFIPVILVTADVRKGPSAVIEAGCEGFLVKPCTPTALRSEVERVLGRNARRNGCQDSATR
jgi:two-component system cell cycle response regulator DivK